MTPNILEMLTYCRPAYSKTERTFVNKYIDTIPGILTDGYGNRILAHPDSRVMIACHTDTVHRRSGRQKVVTCGGMAMLPSTSYSNCLGADDTAGVYTCLRMIEAGIPLTYVFHRSEEIGGLGSNWLADNHTKWLETFDVCLSIDRRGTQDIITSQLGGRCASDEFAWSLAEQLDMGHLPADGIFTDSANYTHLIPECSNLSVGYSHEHSYRESLNLGYLEALIARLIEVDWTALTIARDPVDWYGDCDRCGTVNGITVK